MSGRTIPRFALAGLLAAAFTVPAAAQPGQFPYPLTEIKPALPLAEAPMPRAKQTYVIDLMWGDHFALAAAKAREAAQPSCCGADCCRKPTAGFRVAAPSCCGGLLPLATIPTQRPTNGVVLIQMAAESCPLCPASHGTPNPLLGTWYRETAAGVIAATFTHDELKLCMSQRENAKLVTVTLTAHYTITKDGLVYGAITSADVDVDVDVKGDGKADTGIGMEQAELSLLLQELTDQPFSFRAKMTSAGLMVSQLKAAPFEDMEKAGFAILGGVYKSAKDGRVPEPKALKADAGQNLGYAVPLPPAVDLAVPTVPMAPPMMLDPIQRVGVDFNFNLPVGQPGVLVLPPCPAPANPVCGGTTKAMAADAFHQMLHGAGGTTGGMTLPSPRYLEHYPQYFAPDPACPLPRELACQEDPEGAVRRSGGFGTGTPAASTVPAKPGIVGTWYRDIGSKRCVVKIAGDHFTVTVSEVQEEDGQTTIAHLTFTADYQLTRDGMTAVGLLTSVDVKFDGDLPGGDADGIAQKVGELQKLLEDKPFALTFRLYGDALVIGNVRMPTVGGDQMEAEPAAYVGGRYKAVGDKPLPKQKAVKMSELKGPPPVYVPLPPGAPVPYNGPAFGPGAYGPPMPLPPYGYGPYPGGPALMPQPGPVYSQPPVSSGVPSDLLPPAGVPVRPAESVAPAPRHRAIEIPSVPSMNEPTPPVPQMSEPVEPQVSVDTERKVQATDMAVAWRNRIAYLPDPSRNGAVVAGVSGQLFLYGGQNMQFALADGTLTVDLIDETPRPAGQSAAKAERWQIDKDTLRKLSTTDDTFGKSYALFLPWPGSRPDITHVRISVRYDTDRQTLYTAPSVVSLTPVKEPNERTMASPQMPEPAATVPPELGRAEPSISAPTKTSRMSTILGINQYSSDPNIRMQQLLYQSEDLRQMQNEWRRFWFNDQPSHPTPERIKGGIY